MKPRRFREDLGDGLELLGLLLNFDDGRKGGRVGDDVQAAAAYAQFFNPLGRGGNIAGVVASARCRGAGRGAECRIGGAGLLCRALGSRSIRQ